MDLPGSGPAAAAAASLAGFVRDRLADLADLADIGSSAAATFTPRWARPDEVQDAVHDAVAHVAMLIAGATAPFATTSYARARLLRQLHATGLLTEREGEQAVELLDRLPLAR